MTNNHPDKRKQQRPPPQQQPPPPPSYPPPYNNNYHNHHNPMFPPQRKHAYPPDPSHLFYYYHPYSYGVTPDYPSQDNARKRQRRQTAGAFMQNLFSGGASVNGGGGAAAGGGKKKNSTAQPRPMITVPPGGIGPVRDLNDNDVLSGRGGRINAHKGNVQFRELVLLRKKDYLAKTTKKLEKAHIAAEIVRNIRSMNPPGRFLKEEKDGAWWDIGDAKAIKKVGQALREDAQDIRTNQPGGGGGDDSGDRDDSNKDSTKDGKDSSHKDKKSSNDGGSSNNIGSPKVGAKQTSNGAASPSPSGNNRAGPVPQTPKSNKAVATADAGVSGGKPVPKGVTVSGRGAKKIVSKHSSGATSKASSSSDHQQQQQSKAMYQPLAYQEIAPPPSYHPVLPPTPTASGAAPHRPIHPHQFQAAGGVGGIRGGGVSGAAAAAMGQGDQDDDLFQVPQPAPGDVAFGMPYHPPPARIDANRETSLVSGLSGPSALSGLSSNMSGLSDPMSSLTAKTFGGSGSDRHGIAGGYGNSGTGGYNTANSERQLQHLRQQWAHKKQTALDSSMASSAMTGTRQQLLASTGLGSSLGRSNSLTDLNAGMDNVSMTGNSIADHSLMGGGIGASGSIHSTMSFATMQSVIPIRDMRDPSEIASDVSGGGVSAAMLSLARSTSGGRRGSGHSGGNSYWGSSSHRPYHPATAAANHPSSAFYQIQQPQPQQPVAAAAAAAAGGGVNPYLAQQYQVPPVPPQQQQQHPQQPAAAAATAAAAAHGAAGGEVASVASMSIRSTSDSLPSVSNSIMSDLSENLIALDLAENKLLDQI